jgi:hypothetical protein
VIVRVWLAGAVGAAGLVALAGPAGASKVSATGTASCSVGAAMTFSPPLQPGIGTVVAKGQAEDVTLSPIAIGGCAGTSSTLPSSGAPTRPIVVKVKPNVSNKKLYAGGCLFLSAMQLQIKHATLAWTTASGTIRPTKAFLGIAGLSNDAAGNLGFSFVGTATGSFAGSAALTLYTDAVGTAALKDCESNLGGPITSVTVDATQSALALG